MSSVILGTLASAGTYALCKASISYLIDEKSPEDTKKSWSWKRKEEVNKLEMSLRLSFSHNLLGRNSCISWR